MLVYFYLKFSYNIFCFSLFPSFNSSKILPTQLHVLYVFSLQQKQNENKTKQKDSPNMTRILKQIETKKCTKIWNSFCVNLFVLSYSQAWSLPWKNVVSTCNDTPLEKTDFPFPSRYQLRIASLLEVGIFVYSFVLGFCLVWNCAGLVWCHSFWVHMCIISVVSQWCGFTTSGLYNLSLPLQHKNPRVEWNVDKGISFRDECSKISHSLHIFPSWGLNDALFYV